MKRYAKIIESIVTQIQPYIEDGFVEVPLDVIAGMVDNGDGTFAIPAKTPEEIQALAISYFTGVTTRFIHARVIAYNRVHGTAFADVHNCESYSRANGYTHQVWCAKVFAWSVNVWEAVREYQNTVPAPPTEEEFQAILDGVVF